MRNRWRSTPVIGRPRELAAIRSAVDAANEGVSTGLIVLGEAGIGKSRLVAEAVEQGRRRGSAVLVGRAVEGSGPYRPIAEALLGHLRSAVLPESDELKPFRPALGRLLPGWAEPEQESMIDAEVVLGEGVVRLLGQIAAVAGTSQMVLEDLHWSDHDTLGLLEYVLPALPGSGVSFVLSWRTDGKVDARLDRLRRLPDVEVLTLAPMADSAIAQLAAARLGSAALPAAVTRFLVEGAEGIPLLAEELLADLVATGKIAHDERGWTQRGKLTSVVPRSIAEVMENRLATAEAGSRRVLQAAAVIGRDVPWRTVVPVAGLDKARVAKALQEGVFLRLLTAQAGGEGTFSWRHALIRQTVINSLLPSEHAALAMLAAQALEADPAAVQADGPRIAELYAQGGAPQTAVDLLVRLARRAFGRGAAQSAMALLERALELGGGPVVLVAQVRILALIGRGNEALAIGERMLAEGQAETWRVELSLSMARAAITVAQWERAQRCLRLADAPNDARVLALAADIGFGAGDVAGAASLAAQAIEAAQRDGLPSTLCEALEVTARCARVADLVSAAPAFRRAAEVAEAHGLAPWRIRALFGLATVELLTTGSPSGLDTVADLAREAGMLAEVVGVEWILTDHQSMVQGPGPAMLRAARCAELAGRLRLWPTQAMALVKVAHGHLVHGQIGEMNELLEESGRIGVGSVDVSAVVSAVKALQAFAERDHGRATALLDDAVASALSHESAALLPYCGFWALLRASAGSLEDTDLAQLRRSPLLRRPANGGGVHYAAGLIHGRNGREAQAQASIQKGDRLLAGQDWIRRLLRLILLEDMVVRGWGDPVHDLSSDLVQWQAAGDDEPARRCRDLLRRIGAKVPRQGRGDAPVPEVLRQLGVTSREMDVLLLVAQDLTNAEIAARMFLSRRTVDTHVANLLRKTGVSRRKDLLRFTDLRGSDA